MNTRSLNRIVDRLEAFFASLFTLSLLTN